MSIYSYNFRLTAGFIAADPYSVIPADTHPQSSRPGMLPFGWIDGAVGFTNANRSAAIDARLGGVFLPPGPAGGGYQGFRVDLNALGVWRISLAIGDQSGAINPTTVLLQDGGVTFATLTDVVTSGANRWRDATNVELTEATWPTSNAPISRTFTSTTLALYAWGFGSSPGAIAHLGLEGPFRHPVGNYTSGV